MPPAMTDRELDAAIAEKVMGWVVRRMPRPPFDSYHDPAFPVEKPIPPFSTDRNAAALVLERIGELGLGDAFMSIHVYNMKTLVSFRLLTATPRQLMEAALIAVKEKA